MYGTILTFIKFNNFGTRHLNGPRHLFHSFCCTTRHLFEPLRVYEPGFNIDKYGTYICSFTIASSHVYTYIRHYINYIKKCELVICILMCISCMSYMFTGISTHTKIAYNSAYVNTQILKLYMW